MKNVTNAINTHFGCKLNHSKAPLVWKVLWLSGPARVALAALNELSIVFR